METLTLAQSTIRGFVAGKMVNCAVRSSPAGLTLPAGQYLLRPAADNPVYGLVMSIEPMRPGGQGPASVKLTPAGLKVTPAAVKMTPAAVKMAPAAVKMTPAGLKMAPASKVDSPAAWVQQPGAIVISGRAIAGNSLVVTLGFGDLVDAVQRAGGVALIVT
jgi:hypothetical protein